MQRSGTLISVCLDQCLKLSIQMKSELPKVGLPAAESKTEMRMTGPQVVPYLMDNLYGAAFRRADCR